MTRISNHAKLAGMLGIDTNHEFYRPLWRRLVICGICIAWAVFESFIMVDSFWSMITVALAAYATAKLIFFYKEPK